MKRIGMGLIGLLIVCAPVLQGQQAGKAAPPGKTNSASGDVARGKYLVENVAMCGQCHTPRDDNGALDQHRALQGAPVLWVPASGADSNWPLQAPRIGGTPPASDVDMVKLLTTGIWITGQPLRLPMMPFRMSEGDAKAVVAYLRALTPQQ
jgi:mono/diheme cytochrome c family protein